MLGRAEILLHLALAHVLREAIVLHVLVDVLAHWFRSILLVEVLQIHAVYSLGGIACGNLQGVHLAWVHLGVIWVEGPREVAHHLLTHCSRRLNLSLLAIFGNHQILRDIGGSCSVSEVNRVIGLLAGGARHCVARVFVLLLISRVLCALHGLLILVL